MKKTEKITSIAVLVLIAVVISSTFLGNNFNKKETEFLSASWFYNYRDIEEISQASDAIALIKVDGVVDSYDVQDIPITEYKVDVVTSVYNTNKGDTFTIVMTGKETNDKIIEVNDDPLLQKGEEFLVFCKKNTDGTYRIISGPQGRLAHSNGKLSSLNAVDARVKAENPYSNITVVNADVNELISQIKSYVGVE
jgi:hypothetical protein